MNFIDNHQIETFKFSAKIRHKNLLGILEDKKTHSHKLEFDIKAWHGHLSKQYMLFNLKTIASFLVDLIDNQDMNNLLENRKKSIDKKYQKYIKDVPNEPTVEVMNLFFVRICYAKIVTDNPEMKGLTVGVGYRKKDGIRDNNDRSAETYSYCETTEV